MLTLSLELVYLLEFIERMDIDQNYEERNKSVMLAMAFAAMLDFPTGIRYDPDEPEWPVVFIELPTGQCSWHLPQHPTAWDGHDNHTKYVRIHSWIASQDQSST